MIQSSTAPLRDLPVSSSLSSDSSKSITIITSKNRERSGSDPSNSVVSNDSSIFDTNQMSETASITSSATSDDDHDVDYKHHPPRIGSKTFIPQQMAETIKEDPDEDSEDGDRMSPVIADEVHPAVKVTKANDVGRPATPPSLRVKTQNLADERPVEMRHHHKVHENGSLPVANGTASAKTPLGAKASATSTASVGTPLTPAKKEKSFFHLPKLHRSKSQALLPAEGKAHTSLKSSIKNVFSHNNSANSTMSIPPTPPSSQPSSVPGTPHGTPQFTSAEPDQKISTDKMKYATPSQGPRRVSSVGPNMMLNKHLPASVSPTQVETMHHNKTYNQGGVGHKAVNGRSNRAISEPPEPTIRRAKTLKEVGITNRGKHAGKGATSTVTRCSSNGKVLALKAFKKPSRTESDVEFKRRIDIEFEIAHSLHHPNVVETMELIWDEGKHNWAETMEWCGGGDLFTIIKFGHMTALERNCCFKQLIRGVSYMHSMGIAHRDIKPENLLLNEEGQLKITDFGVSDVVVKDDGGSRKCRGLCGSEPYMAPEVHTQKEYDGSPLDIWSCGIVYLCLAFGGLMWTKAAEGNPGYDKFIAAIRKFELHKARKEARIAAAEQAKAEAAKAEAAKAESAKAESVKTESVKAESVKAESVKAESVKAESVKGECDKAITDDAQSFRSEKPEHLDAGKSDVDKMSLKSETDDNMSRISSALSFQIISPTSSPPNGHTTPPNANTTPTTPILSRANSNPNTPVEKPHNPAPPREKTFKLMPSIKPVGMIQSPRPIYEAPGAVKGEVHLPAPHYPPFESFQPLQKRLIYRILDPNPATRISANDILKDPWFKEIGCCSFDPDELVRVQSGFFDASKASGGMKKGMPVKHKHPNHLINGKAKK